MSGHSLEKRFVEEYIFIIVLYIKIFNWIWQKTMRV